MLEATQQDMNVTKRDGRVLSFDPELITKAIQKAFCAEKKLKRIDELAADLLAQIDEITQAVLLEVRDDAMSDSGVTVEHIQDVVERELMKAEYFSVAR